MPAVVQALLAENEGGVAPGSSLSDELDDEFGSVIGSLLRRSITEWESLPPEDDGDVLTLVSGLPEWMPPSGGGSGTVGFEYVASDTTTDSDPGVGTVRWNNATQAAASFLYIDEVDVDSTNADAIWADLPAGSKITITDAADPDTWQRFNLTAVPVDGTGYWKLAVALEASEGSDIVDTAAVFVDIDSSGTSSTAVVPSGINLQTGSGVYTAVLGDADVVEVQRSNAAANNVTIPPNTSVNFPIGTQIGVRMLGTGQTSVLGGVGVTVNTLASPNLQAQGALAVVIQTATDVWWLTGELLPTVVYKGTQALEPANTTVAGTLMGMVITSSATVSHPTQALTNLQTAIRRIRWATTAVAGNASGFFETIATKVQGSAGLGGYTCVFRFGISVNTTGMQCFVGLGPAAALAGDPSAVLNMIGMGFDAADTSGGNWQLMRNDGSGTAFRVDLGGGAVRNTTSIYKLILRAFTALAGIYVTVINEESGVVVLDTNYSTDIPATTTYLAARGQVRNGALSSAMQLDFAHYDAGMQE